MCIKSMSEHCLIKKNTPELRKKLEDAGVLICHMMYIRMMSLLTCVNKLKGNDYAVDYLQATIR